MLANEDHALSWIDGWACDLSRMALLKSLFVTSSACIPLREQKNPSDFSTSGCIEQVYCATFSCFLASLAVAELPS